MRHGMCSLGCMNRSVFWSAFCAFVALGAGVAFTPRSAATPPEVSYSVAPENPVARSPFRVTYEVRWDGGPESLGVIPAEPAAVVWGKARLADATSVADADGQAIRFTVEYVSDRYGEVQVPPLALSYVLEPPLEERQKVVADASATAGSEVKVVEPQSLEAPGFSVAVGRNVDPVVIAVSAMVLALVAAAALAAIRLRRRRAMRVSTPAAGSTVQSMLNLARQHRLDGKFYEYYRELARASTLMAPSIAAKKLREKLEHHAQQVGYGALHPTEDDLEGAVRDLEKVLREHTRAEQ